MVLAFIFGHDILPKSGLRIATRKAVLIVNYITGRI